MIKYAELVKRAYQYYTMAPQEAERWADTPLPLQFFSHYMFE